MSGFHIGFGATPGDASDALGGLQSRIEAAAKQQQQVQAKTDQQTTAEQLDMARLINEGWQVYDPDAGAAKDTTTGLMRRSPAPRPDNMVTLPTIGKQLYRPAQTDKEKAAQSQQQYTDLRTALDQGAEPAQGNTIYAPGGFAAEQKAQMTLPSAHQAVDPARIVTPPGSGQRYYMPSAQDKENAKPGAEPTVDTEHFSTPVSIDHRTGQVTALQLPPGVTHNDKPAKPAKFTYNHYTDDNGKLTVTRIGSGDDAAPEMWTGKAWAPVPAGAAVGTKRKDPDAAPGPRPATPTQLVAIEGRKRAGLARAEQNFKKAMATATVSGYTDPDSQKEALDDLRKDKQAAQDAYEEALGTYGQQVEHYEYPPEETPADPAATAATASSGGGRGAPQTPNLTAKPKTAQAPKVSVGPGNTGGQQAQQKPQVTEGTIIRNKTTGARQQWKGGKWVPL